MLYEYKSDNNIQDYIFECFCPLLEDVIDEYSNLRRNESLSIYMPSDMATEFVGMLLNEDIGLWVSEESDNRLLHEDTDVLISICDDGMLLIEEAKYLNGRLKPPADSPLVYFYDGYKYKELKELDDGNTSILVYGFVDDFCDEYEDEGFLDLFTDENDDVVGFHAYRETDEGFFGYEFHSSDSMDEDDIYKILRKVGMI